MHGDALQDTLVCVGKHIHTCDMKTHSYVRHENSFIRAKYVRRDSCMCDSDNIFCIANTCFSYTEQILERLCVLNNSFIRAIWFVYVWLRHYPLYIKHMFFTHRTYSLTLMCVEKTHSYVQYDSCMCDSDTIFYITTCVLHTQNIFSHAYVCGKNAFIRAIWFVYVWLRHYLLYYNMCSSHT